MKSAYKKEFDTKPVYNKEFLKTKIKSHGDKLAYFHDKKNPKMDSNHSCLVIISIDLAVQKDENHYPLVLLKKFK